MTKEQVVNMLEEEEQLTAYYESNGLTTSDAQGASSTVMVKKYGLDSFGALRQLPRDEAKALLSERE